MSNASPRDLDPKFKDAKLPDDAEQKPGKDETVEAPKEHEETSQETLTRLRSTEIPKNPGEGNIVYRKQVIDSAGNAVEQIHGPMPVSEWAKYSAEKGL